MTLIDCFSITDKGELHCQYSPEYHNLFAGEITIPTHLTDVKVTSVSGFCNAPMTSINIPDGVRIEAQTFKNCKALRSVRLPLTIQDIFPETFSGCDNLEVSLLPPSLQRIHQKAFYGCASIQHSILPASVTKVGTQAFTGCHRNLILNVLGNNTHFEECAVQKCHIIFLAENYKCQHRAENGSSHPFADGTILHVPQGSKAVYQECFCDQYEIVEFE